MNKEKWAKVYNIEYKETKDGHTKTWSATLNGKDVDFPKGLKKWIVEEFMREALYKN